QRPGGYWSFAASPRIASVRISIARSRCLNARDAARVCTRALINSRRWALAIVIWAIDCTAVSRSVLSTADALGSSSDVIVFLFCRAIGSSTYRVARFRPRAAWEFSHGDGAV